MHAIAFICTAGGPGIPNMIVQILYDNKVLQGVTNQDGYVLFNFVPNNQTVQVFIWGAGYQNYYQSFMLGDQNKNYPITLIPSFNKPSRDRIINVKANLCNLRDADDIPIFEIFISSLLYQGNYAKANDWVNRLKAASSTHINLAISYDYPEYLGWADRYPIPGLDLMNQLDNFNYIVNWVKSKGFIPIIKLAFDGQGFNPEGLTYGWQYGLNNLVRISKALSSHIESVLWSTGFDGCFPDWSPIQTIQMIRWMRQVLGTRACIDTEFGGASGTWAYITLGDDYPNGGWTTNELYLLDHFSIEALAWPLDIGPLQQIATRLLGPECLIGPQTPYYLAGADKTIAIDYYETNAYQSIRKQIMPSQAVQAANLGKSYGFKVFGNGIPS